MPSRQAILLVLVATTFVITAGAANAAQARLDAPDDCRQVAANLRERLESVTEACIDGRAADLRVAADRAGNWWASRQSPWPTFSGSDSLIRGMRSAARRHDSNRAALVAVRLSMDSFRWCDVPPSTTDDLMVLDLAGAAGWLRAHGESLEWPSKLGEVTSRVDEALARKGRADLGPRLKKAVADLLTIPNRSKAGFRAAITVLDLVDELEKALR